jgi:hypothetical protein
MKRRDVLQSPRLAELKKQRRNSQARKIFLVVFSVLLFVSAAVFISRAAKLNIKEVVVSGNKVIDTELIKEVADRHISGDYFWFFPKTNFLIYPKDQIRAELEEKYKRLKDISFNLRNDQVLEISVGEREGKYTWCGEKLPVEGEEPTVTDEGSGCYFMDESGYIFDEAPYFSGEVYFRFFGPIENIEEVTGNYFLPGVFQKVVYFKDNLPKGLTPALLLLYEDGNMDMFLVAPTEPAGAPRIMFTKDADFEKMAENLQAAVLVDPLKSGIEKNFLNLEYIDLRYGNKVYYKFRNGISNE